MKKGRIGSGLPLALALGLGILLPPQTLWAQVKLEYKFPEGSKQTYKSTTNTSQVLTINGQGIETGSKQTVVSSTTIGKKRGDSSVPVEEKVDSLSLELSLPGGVVITFDSKDPGAKVDNPQLAPLIDMYKLISQMAYTVVLDAQNKVKAVEGTEKLLEKIDGLDETIKPSIRGRLDAQRLKTEFEQAHGNLPEVLARPGEPWERTETLDIGGGQTLTFQKKYEYAGTEQHKGETLEKINVKTTGVTYAMDPDAASPLKVTKSDLKIASGDGVILFNREGGHIVTAKGKTQIKGPMTFQAGGQELPGEVDLTISSESELQPAGK